LAELPSQHSRRNCWRTAGSLRPSHVARNALTAVSAQERASTMPRLHRAKTVACGLLKWGKCVWIMVVHSVTRGWQDIRILLGVMGVRQPPIPCPTEGCLVTSCMLLYRHFSKTYCRKGPPPGSGSVPCVVIWVMVSMTAFRGGLSAERR